MTIDEIKQDIQDYVEANNLYPVAPTAKNFFYAQSYSIHRLYELNIRWSDLTASLGLQTRRGRHIGGRNSRPYRRKGIKKDPTAITVLCDCGKKFKSPVDKKGVKINYRCDACKQQEFDPVYIYC